MDNSKLDDGRKQLIVDKINEKIKGLSCPMCRNISFSLGDGYFLNSMQTDLYNHYFGGPSIPTIPIICNNCGFISQHALGTLGLLPKEEETKK